MAFYLEKAIFINRAPFKHLEIDFKEKGINVLTAVNGKGKTTILTYIVDSLYELAKKHYHNEFENKTNKYYRISSALYNIQMNKPSYVYLRFKNNDRYWDYLDVKNNCSQEEYDQAINIENKIPFHEFGQSLKENQNIKYWSHLANTKKDVLSVFDTNVLTSFPSYRYEIPSYLNTPYTFSIEHKRTLAFTGHLINPIEVITGISELSNWILDVLLDLKSNEQRILLPAERGYINQLIPAQENTLWENLNKILAQSLSSKKYQGGIRFGIGSRNGGATRISVINDIDHSRSELVSPSIFNLSSGELALISLFGEVLRQSDNLQNNIPLSDIQGIVLVDEIDKHLHITLQKEVLPKLMMMFPNVQFIVSSHSPFLNMGLADETKERSQIIDLDNNGLVCEPTNNDLYKEVYEMMINENQRFAEKYKDLEDKTKIFNKPVIITEGKTDWKHIKAALAYFKGNHEYEDIDVEVLEYDFDFGDSKLHSLLNQYKTFPHRYKIVGIFDCDEGNGRMIHSAGGTKQYGDNIWGMSIPVPDYRNYNFGGISIEFLYMDEDLKRQDEKGRRLYVTSEFNENGRFTSDVRIGVKNIHDVKNYILPEKEKIQADEVIDIDGYSLALSKEQFATNILERRGDFANVCFDAFRPVFDRLRTILQS